MTTQEKIDQLTTAAMRSAPAPWVPPTPTTYMAPFEKPRTLAMVGTPPSSVPRTVTPAVSATQAALTKGKTDPELHAQIDEREVRIRKTRQRRSLAVTLVALAICGSAGFWGYKSPVARAGIAALVPALRQSADDVKIIASTPGKCDKQFDQIAVHGEQIDEATRAIGIDPASVSAQEKIQIATGMETIMKGDGRTTRDHDLKSKSGVVGKLVGTQSRTADGVKR